MWLLMSLTVLQFFVESGQFILERFTTNNTNSAFNFDQHQFRRKRSIEEKNQVAANTSILLNSILRNYDKSFRPNFDKNEPTLVYIDIFVRTMGPISEKTDTYAFDCYFRQTWRDNRLRFQSPNRKVLSLGMSMLDKIWKPDTYFWNGQASYLHTLTTPNRLVRLSEDGVVLYSSRLTVKAKCQMDLRRYPLDIQACRLVVGSFAYGINEMIFRWKVVGENRGVHMDYAALTELPQFEMAGFKVYNSSPLARDTNYSTLEARFFLHRHIGYFIINFYIPCTLIVLLSWVALWINREATGDRIGLGITSVLTLTFLSLDSRSDFRVDFPTALDVYILICFVALLICIIEFTIVHYFTKFHTGDPEIQRSEQERLRNILRRLPKESMLGVGIRNYNRPNARQSQNHPNHLPMKTFSDNQREHSRSGLRTNGLDRRDGGRYSMYWKNRKTSSMHQRQLTPQQSQPHRDHHFNFHDFQKDSIGWRVYYWMIHHSRRADPFGIQENSMSAIDRISRVVLPITFAVVVIIYYNFYVSRPHDLAKSDWVF